MAESSDRTRISPVLIVLIALLGCGLTAYRGFWRSIAPPQKLTQSQSPDRGEGFWHKVSAALTGPKSSFDLAIHYAATCGWVHGENPYDANALDELWLSHGGESEGEMLPSKRGSENVLYPPSTYTLLSPLALFDWPTARLGWAILSIVAVLASILALGSLTKSRLTSREFLLFASCCLCFAPLHTGLALGQTSGVAIAFVVLAHAARLRKQVWLSGVLLGLAAGLKPQLGMIFIVYEFAMGRVRIGVISTLVISVAFLVGAIRMWAADISWFDALSTNVQAFTTSGTGAPTAENPLRFHMINLHPILHVFLHDSVLVNRLAFGITATLGIAFMIPWLRRRRADNELLALSMSGVLSLLVVYHRFYDAAIMFFVLAWCYVALSRQRRSLGIVMTILIVPFFVPGTAFLKRIEGTLPHSLTESWVWDNVILLHPPYLLLGIAITLCVAMYKSDRDEWSRQ